MKGSLWGIYSSPLCSSKNVLVSQCELINKCKYIKLFWIITVLCKTFVDYHKLMQSWKIEMYILRMSYIKCLAYVAIIWIYCQKILGYKFWKSVLVNL